MNTTVARPYALETALVLASWPLLLCCVSAFGQLSNGVYVNNNYDVDPNGKWIMLDNFHDQVPGPYAPCDVPYWGWERPLLKSTDLYRFPEIAEPTVLKLTSVHGTPNGATWYYFTGTCRDQYNGNFKIYRTSDFKTFQEHMTAFENAASEAVSFSGQWKQDYDDNPGPGVSNRRRIYLNRGKWYEQLWAPHLYIDPSENGDSEQMVYLAFSAVEGEGTPYQTQEQHHSCFLVKIRIADFLAWHSQPGSQLNRHFADSRVSYDMGDQHWYAYRDDTGAFMYDGGWSYDELIPVSGSVAQIRPPGYCGWFEQRYSKHWPYDDDPPPTAEPVGTMSIHCWSAASFMAIDPFVFIDSDNPDVDETDPWYRTMIYTWDDRHYSVPFAEWGNHIAAYPLSDEHYVFPRNDGATGVGMNPLAFCRNSNSGTKIWVRGLDTDFPPNAPFGFKDSGTADDFASEWENGSVAEGGTVFYHAPSDRYYFLFARNCWDSSYYRIMYRFTPAGGSLNDLFTDWGDDSVLEHILIQAYEVSLPRGANFGGPEVFTIYDPNTGSDVYYLAFHAMLDEQSELQIDKVRRMFVKELTFRTDPGHEGELVRLLDLGDEQDCTGWNKTYAASKARWYRIPRPLP